ncbi:ADP-glyceromanno-heptose 6-epimerase [Desulfovibrio sp. TomC]|uniref:ADP-glyceromanno-heptose 6-epimerase n=1 Tax=Desulfovibrio sp. TomC TaxID=1562888 RepID=UPI0005731576|nr:ADP-glyceromanno-heptose 6-epimerase [Desulfovibrio sp. TomC]KHK00672.1 ADP-L-glycero-D-manno-heptose-6-epimerase [Desulfovibrio sp. TomC]
MILITGAAGFIGSNFAAALNEQGMNNLVFCDRLRSGGKWLNVRKRQFDDFVFPEDLPQWLAGRHGRLRAVFHMGAISSTTVVDGDAVLRENLKCSLALLDWCAVAGVPFIYASSAATYGNGRQGFNDEFTSQALARLTPLNLYGFSKHAFDGIVCRRRETGGMLPPQCVGLKFFNVFGPNELHKGSMQSVLTKVWPDIAQGKAVRLFRSHIPEVEDGGQRRDFVYIRDVEQVMLWLLEHPAVSGLFNVGTGTARSFKDFIGAGFAAAGRNPAIEYVDMPLEIRDKYQYFTQADLTGLRGAGYQRPFTPLQDAVAHYVQNHLLQECPYR